MENVDPQIEKNSSIINSLTLNKGILEILYPLDFNETDIVGLIINIEDNIGDIKEIRVLNHEISLRLFLFLIKQSMERKIQLAFSENVYSQYKAKEEALTKLTHFDKKLIKVLDE